MMRRGPGHIPAGHGPPPNIQGPGVSNVTNSSDFASKDSRVFAGNLNTFLLSKEDVDGIFRRYGMVTGISMHKGYAFVQFSHPGEARRAVGFENGQMYAGQPLDLNIVSEPKHRAPQKRNAGPPIMESRRPPNPMQASPSMPPMAKRARQDSNPSLMRGNLVTLAAGGKPPGTMLVGGKPRMQPRAGPYASTAKVAAAAAVKRATATATKTASSAIRASTNSTAVSPQTDVLICGVCKMQFTSLHSLAQHKKIPCRLRASCQCHINPPKPQPEDKEPTEYDCATCDARFNSAWALCQHCQDEHSVSIYKTKDSTAKPNNVTPANKVAVKTETETKNGKDDAGEATGKTEETKKTTTPTKK